MGEGTKIEWCDHTFNPWWGCEHVSPACDHCYAESFANRFGRWFGKGTPRKFFADRHWAEPLAWDRKAEREGQRASVFCGSMCDIFEDRAELQPQRERLWDLVASTPALDWLLLTKRPENIPMQVAAWMKTDVWGHVYYGVTVENQAMAESRITQVARLPYSQCFLSMEPLLGPVDIRKWIMPNACPSVSPDGLACTQRVGHDGPHTALRPTGGWGPSDDPGPSLIGGVIVGGETGPAARPMHPDWVRSIRDQCLAAGVPFFFKQWGEWATYVDPYPIDDYPRRGEGPPHPYEMTHWILPDGRIAKMENDPEDYWDESGATIIGRVGKKRAGRLLDGRTWNQLYWRGDDQ